MSRVLVIDDDDAFRQTLATSLSKRGYDVLEATNGAQGVQEARAQTPDLILCDVNMSGADGYLTLHALRHDPKLGAVPFLLMTGQPDNDGLRQAMELGADDYLVKPFTTDELISALEARLNKHRDIRQEVEKKLAELRASITTALPDELLSPVNSIVNLTEFISTGYRQLEPGDVIGLCKDVHQSALRLKRLVQNCLLYAEIQVIAADPEKAGSLRTKHKTYARDVVEPALIQKARSARRYDDLALERTLSNVQLAIAPEHLKKIVEEVLDNAFKFSKPGTPVKVRTAIAHRNFTFSVADQGKGMTGDQIAHIGAYVQFERKLHEQHGSGLGLTIAKRLAELHNGAFSVQAEPGRGTTVSVSLPQSPSA